MPANGKATPEQVNRLERLVENAVYSLRTDIFKRMFDPRRDIDDECGYPRVDSTITAQEYQQLYDREPIPARVCECLPKECWQVQPLIYEKEKSSIATPFEKAWDELAKQMRGGSLYQDEGGSPIWEALLKADVLSRIGQYGVILLGLGDKDLSQPAKKGKLLFLRCFPEALADITQFESDVSSPRFGQPNQYLITFNDPRESFSGTGLQAASAQVHWSRVIHVSGTSDQMSSSDVLHPPSMRPVLNRLLDLRKIYSGDGEAWWRNAVMKIFFETHPQLGGDVEVDESAMRDMMERMMNSLQQWGLLKGMAAKTVAPVVSDPTPHVAVQIEAICIKLGIPVRVFKGSERGELASSQDDASWNDRLKHRQQYCVTPRIIIPFIDRLIFLGILPEPSGYSVEWPDLTSQSDAERADILVKRTTAFAQYASGGVGNLIPELDYLTREAGYDEEEAQAILEQAEKEAEEKLEEQQAVADEQGFEPVPPDGFKAPEAEQPEMPIKVKEGEKLVKPDGKPFGG